MFDNFNVKLRKNEGFLTDIPCIPFPDYGQSNAPLVVNQMFSSNHAVIIVTVSGICTSLVAINVIRDLCFCVSFS